MRLKKILDREKVIKFTCGLSYRLMYYIFKADRTGKKLQEPYEIIGQDTGMGGLAVATVREANKYNYIEEVNEAFVRIFEQMSEEKMIL